MRLRGWRWRCDVTERPQQLLPSSDTRWMAQSFCFASNIHLQEQREPMPLSPSPPSHCLAPLVSPLSSLLKVCPLPLLASSAVPVSLAVSRGGGGKSPGKSKDGRAQDKLCVQTPLCLRLPPATKKHQEAKKQTWHSGQMWMRQKRDKIRLAGPQPGAPARWPGPGWGPRLSSPAL